MGKTFRIGFYFMNFKGWTGGNNYIYNYIHALNTLPVEEQAEVVIYTNSQENFNELKRNTDYQKLVFSNTTAHYSFTEKIINKISQFILGKNLVDKRIKAVDHKIFPNPGYDFENISENQLIYWIPDFQEEYLGGLFSDEEIASRRKQNHIISQKTNIVLSSRDAFNDFKQFYPNYKGSVHIIPFSVFFTKTNDSKNQFEQVKSKYNLSDRYFYCPNQFWQHKNHMLLINAVKNLVNEGIDIKVYFSGNEMDNRNPGHIDKLKSYVKDNVLMQNIQFLGFVSRNDLQTLIQYSHGIIQPSLFEGWSTVLEEAKFENKYILASDINIHKEQLADYPNKSFFKAKDLDSITDTLKSIWANDISINKYDYTACQKAFANKIMELFK
ncbi:glycosyltransferase [Carboxylicivirga linearis]|uniref:Glycosyltransferase n=1 Tax=Carboxylicivirga linearis TaxID=1628157 RepID=A0ABS5JUF8_9BACT|nr:glycosyltransferase [Carboxylicivirga linearis]MBS2098545.1 glycosyltransferase [Carboxylicivirga linearis]